MTSREPASHVAEWSAFAVGAVQQDMNFASRIETIRPNIEVYNFGVSAIGPEDYHLILRTEALALYALSSDLSRHGAQAPGHQPDEPCSRS